MKTLTLYLTFVFMCLLCISCTKAKPGINRSNPVPISYSPPRAYAGDNILLFLPVNETVLEGSYSTAANNPIKEVNWEKISGPGSYNLENKNSARTRLRQLEKGTYEFELTIRDQRNMIGRDTMSVTVVERRLNGELIFENRTWTVPWYPTLEVPNFHSWIPPGAPFQVFVKRDNSSVWIEATHISNYGDIGTYQYFIETRPDGGGMYTYGSMHIFYYGPEGADTPDVKITW